MTLRNIPYTTSSGEWLPHNAGNYTSRSKAMFFFHSFENETLLGTGTVNFLDFKNLENTLGNILPDSFPIIEQVTYNALFDSIKIYSINYTKRPNHDEIFIELRSPFSLATYTTFGLTETEFNLDLAIYTQYKSAFLGLIDSPTEFPPASNPPGINPNLLRFDWGLLETLLNNGSPINCAGIVSQIIDYNLLSYSKTERDDAAVTSRETIQLKIKISSTDFPATVGSGNWICEGRTIEFNPSYRPDTLSGNIIETSIANTDINSYIEINDATNQYLGRYQVQEVYPLTNGNDALLVKRIDGEEFTLGSHTGVTIKDISVRPRLRIKYRVATDPNPTVIYKFYSKEASAGSLISLQANSSREASTTLVCDEHPILINDVDSDLSVFDFGGSIKSNFISTSLGDFPFGVQTTRDGVFRLTPWRKGYRALNRFRFKEINLRQVNPTSGLNGTLEFGLSPKSAGLPRLDLDPNPRTYPNAIPHRPAVIQERNSSATASGRGNISFTHEKTLLSSTGTVNESLPSATHTVERNTDGIVIEEGQPDEILFTINKNDVGSHPISTAPSDGSGNNYNYAGKVSCATTVIPAYSGEILAFDSSSYTSPTHGFIETNYQLPSGNITPTAVFIDISETDEVLRWNGSEYDPANIWSQTFTSLQIQNLTTGNQIAIDSSSYEVLKSEKDNYIVVLHTDESLAINDGDEMRLTLRNKKVVPDFENTTSPASHMAAGEYIPIEYRPLEKEWIDDILVPFVAPSIPNFTITSDGTVDGTITIVPDGDLPEGVEFRLYIQDDETTP
jgi:hypothetical protein